MRREEAETMAHEEQPDPRDTPELRRLRLLRKLSWPLYRLGLRDELKDTLREMKAESKATKRWLDDAARRDATREEQTIALGIRSHLLKAARTDGGGAPAAEDGSQPHEIIELESREDRMVKFVDSRSNYDLAKAIDDVDLARGAPGTLAASARFVGKALFNTGAMLGKASLSIAKEAGRSVAEHASKNLSSRDDLSDEQRKEAEEQLEKLRENSQKIASTLDGMVEEKAAYLFEAKFGDGLIKHYKILAYTHKVAEETLKETFAQNGAPLAWCYLGQLND